MRDGARKVGASADATRTTRGSATGRGRLASTVNAILTPHHMNAVWTYEAPYDAVAAIRNYLAFLPTKGRHDRGAQRRLFRRAARKLLRPDDSDGLILSR